MRKSKQMMDDTWMEKIWKENIKIRMFVILNIVQSLYRGWEIFENICNICNNIYFNNFLQ